MLFGGAGGAGRSAVAAPGALAEGALERISVKKLRAICCSLSRVQCIYQSVRVRCRMMIAAAFMSSRMTIRTMIAEAAISWESGLAAGRPS